MRREIHPLRLPRLVAGVHHRCREVEGTLVVDEVPVEIPRYDASEAPPAFRIGRGPLHRAAGGAPYVEIAAGGFAAAWAEAYARIELRLRHQLWGGHHDLDPIQRVHGWDRGHLRGAAERRGIGPFEAHRFREVRDDGREAQARAAAAMAGRLALVGDVLLLRTGLPRVGFAMFQEAAPARAGCVPLAWDDPGMGGPFLADQFRIDRPDEARDFARQLAASGQGVAWGETGVEILDAGALAACYDGLPCGPDLGTVAAGNSVAEAMKDLLGHLPEPEIARFLALRAMARDGDAPGIRDWFDGLDGTRAALERESWRLDDHARRKWAAHLGRAVVRLDGIERPRLDLAGLPAAP